MFDVSVFPIIPLFCVRFRHTPIYITRGGKQSQIRLWKVLNRANQTQTTLGLAQRGNSKSDHLLTARDAEAIKIITTTKLFDF